MKAEILRLLRETDGYVSGQELCNQFGVSRTAVWKAINQLKEAGYEIEAVQNKGYHLVSVPDRMDEVELASIRKTEWAGAETYYFDKIDSTNTKAKELAEEGNVKFGFAKKLGINQIKLLEIEGGRNTVSMDIENGTFTPEKLLAMEEAIKSYLRQKDIENRHQEGYQSKLKIYKEKVDRWEEEKGVDYWEERNRKWALFREKLPYNSVSRKSAKIYEKFIKLTTL